MLDRLRAADGDGLAPNDYHLDRIAAALRPRADANAAARADVALSAALLRWLDHVHHGRTEPQEVGWEVRRDRRFDLPQQAAAAVARGGFADWLAQVAEPGDRIGPLLAARDRYRELAESGYPVLADGPTLRPGDRGSRVAALHEQLSLLGDLRPEDTPTSRLGGREQAAELPPGGARLILASASSTGLGREERPGAARHSAPDRFDASTEEAVRRFQERHGLAADGLVGPATQAALNVPPRERLRQIEVNLERLRWLPSDPGERHVIVNIPAFELQAVANGRVVDRMAVVVGEPDWPTPVLSDQIVDFKFAPTWTIPYNIARKETLPQLRRDPGYLERKGIRVLYQGRTVSPWSIDWHSTAPDTYVFRQDPGPRNALGRIRFSLTNGYDIYLHDTPTRFFNRANRALSHGCIRVERPEDLAMFVLGKDSGWDRERLRSAMNASRTHFHELDRPVPVHIVYLTAWVDPASGTLQFRDDVYGRDTALAAALERRATPPLPLI